MQAASIRPQAVRPLPQERHDFVLAAPDRPIATRGLRRRLTPGPAETLGARVRAFFADEADGAAPGLLVGALPFDRMADDCLFQPDALVDPASLTVAGGTIAPGQDWRVRPEPDRSTYEQAVARALTLIASEPELAKIVLSRSLALETDRPIDIAALLARLGGDPGAIRFLTPLDPGANGQPRHLLGATPELLLSRTGSDILSYPLAGSARRSPLASADAASAMALARSTKDHREHRWVVEAILDALAPYCRDLAAPGEPALVATRTMWHLGTRIEGRLKDRTDPSAAELAAALHPTPAVGGVSRERALALIPELEGYDRGFYAGAVGWTDRSGDGAWYVSLRCAEVSGCRARIFAGAGIVEGSVPAEEADETSAKLQAILTALGADERGLTRPSDAPAHAAVA